MIASVISFRVEAGILPVREHPVILSGMLCLIYNQRSLLQNEHCYDGYNDSLAVFLPFSLQKG
jgi:hypothetical protein